MRNLQDYVEEQLLLKAEERDLLDQLRLVRERMYVDSDILKQIANEHVDCLQINWAKLAGRF
jgi:hypothetical protein